jgi:hypothetical protein
MCLYIPGDEWSDESKAMSPKQMRGEVGTASWAPRLPCPPTVLSTSGMAHVSGAWVSVSPQHSRG